MYTLLPQCPVGVMELRDSVCVYVCECTCIWNLVLLFLLENLAPQSHSPYASLILSNMFSSLSFAFHLPFFRFSFSVFLLSSISSLLSSIFLHSVLPSFPSSLPFLSPSFLPATPSGVFNKRTLTSGPCRMRVTQY